MIATSRLRHRGAAGALAIGALTGVSLWATRAVRDLVGSDAAPVRLAMFPSLMDAALLAAVGALAAHGLSAAFTVRSVSSGSGSDIRPFRHLVPLLALTALTLPYC